MKLIVPALVILCPLLSSCQNKDVQFEQSRHNLEGASYASYMKAISNMIDFNGAIEIYKMGRSEFKFYQGQESKQGDKQISASSKFAIASLTKSFTSLLILKLAEDDRIDLNNTIADYLPYYPRDIGDKIKIIDLLNNRSGIPDYTSRYNEVKRSNHNVRDFILEFCAGQPVFEPGSQFQYSNSGFYVLGAIIEEITGLTYKEAMESMVLKKSSMENSGVIARTRNIKVDIVDGHEDMQKSETLDGITTYSAGGIYSTSNDMVKWFKALTANKIISKEMQERVFSDEPIPYHMGWSYTPIKNRVGYSHSGGLRGFNSFMITIPEQDLFVIILCNNSTLPLKRIGIDLVRLALGEKVRIPMPRNDAKVPTPILEKFIGTYRHAAGNEVTISHINGQLQLDIFGFSMPLKADKLNRFYFDQFGPELEFSFDGTLLWIENGNSYIYERVASKQLSESSTISKEEASQLTGEYTTTDQKSRISIEYRDGALYFQLDEQQAHKLKRKTDWNFYYSTSEKGYFFKYPVSFMQEEGEVSLRYDAEVNYYKK